MTETIRFMEFEDAWAEGRRVKVNPAHICAIRPRSHPDGPYCEVELSSGNRLRVNGDIEKIIARISAFCSTTVNMTVRVPDAEAFGGWREIELNE